MKKKVFRERYAEYAKNVIRVETSEEHIKNPTVYEIKPKKRGRKSVKSDK